MSLDVDREDVVVLLFVCDERLAARLDEGVVVKDETASFCPVGSRREAPERLPAGVGLAA
jgi:hypothetical protein